MNIFTKGVLATSMAASAIVSTATPALARDYYRDGDRDNTAAVAIGAGILGLAVGAIAASDNGDRRYRDRDRRYYDRRYRNDGRYYRTNRYYEQRSRRYDSNRYDNRRNWNRGDWNSGDWRRGSSDYRGGYNDRYYSRRGY